jgi:hypothetical protein
MKNNLSGGFTDIELQIITVQFPLFRYITGDQKHLAHQDLILFIFIQVIDCRDMFFGHDQNVMFGFWMDIVKSDYFTIFINGFRGDLFVDDFAKDTLSIIKNEKLRITNLIYHSLNIFNRLISI